MEIFWLVVIAFIGIVGCFIVDHKSTTVRRKDKIVNERAEAILKELQKASQSPDQSPAPSPEPLITPEELLALRNEIDSLTEELKRLKDILIKKDEIIDSRNMRIYELLEQVKFLRRGGFKPSDKKDDQFQVKSDVSADAELMSEMQLEIKALKKENAKLKSENTLLKSDHNKVIL